MQMKKIEINGVLNEWSVIISCSAYLVSFPRVISSHIKNE